MTDLALPTVNPQLLDQATRLLLAPAALEFRQLSKVLADIHIRNVDYADLYFQYSRVESWSLEEGIVKSGAYSVDRGVGVRAVSGEKTAFAYSDDISMDALTAAATATRAIGRQGQSAVATLDKFGGAHALYAPADPVAAISDAEKVALLERLERMARARDPRVTQVMASLAGEYEAILVARSDGLIAADVRPLVRLSLSVIVEENGRREQGMGGGGGRVDYRYFTDPILHEYADRAVDQALLNLGARDAPAGTMTVVLGPGWPGILLHEAIGHGLEGDFNRKGTSAFAGRVGERVAAKGVTVVDDGTIANRRGSLNVDDEGNPTQRTVLIEDGILKGYMQDALERAADGRRADRQRPPRILRAHPDAAHDQYHHAERRSGSRRDHRFGQGRVVCGQLRRRAGGYHQRQVRVFRRGSVEDRERQAGARGQRSDADRQRPRCADPRDDDRQRHGARLRSGKLRQGRSDGTGWGGPAHAAHRRPDRRRYGVTSGTSSERLGRQNR